MTGEEKAPWGRAVGGYFFFPWELLGTGKDHSTEHEWFAVVVRSLQKGAASEGDEINISLGLGEYWAEFALTQKFSGIEHSEQVDLDMIFFFFWLLLQASGFKYVGLYSNIWEGPIYSDTTHSSLFFFHLSEDVKCNCQKRNDCIDPPLSSGQLVFL